MIILGLRCTTSEYTYCIIDGTKKSYILICEKRIKYPNGYSRPDLLKWFYYEVSDLVNKHQIEAIGIKGTEPMGMKSKSYGDRVEIEAMAILTAAEKGITNIERKVNATIAKGLGLKGKAKYLAEFDYSSIPNFSTMPQNSQEAIQIALSMLK